MQESGLDLALLGHQHGAGIWRHDNVRCIYPGSPEPLSWSEAEEKHGIMLVQVHDQQCRVEHVPLAQWRYVSQEIDLTGCDTADERRARVEQALATIPGGLDDRTICRITLCGQSAPESCLEEWTEQIRSPAILQLKTRFVPVPDLDALAQEQTVRGLLVQRFQARLQGAATDQERRQVSSALRYALSALDGKQVQLDEVD
jgi:DNA repair exonuclease SbcCD nuclease subunit